ncbi:alpha/beta hydrolase [Chitinophaga eiseniae]|uniref:Alpha/beta hydrolase n=1 Tax=Chitinophaga eiseniae TaxID=634771 RepID=A0A847SM50_9BACT|nr:alpha/beta hydrolase [Chitinophaga eiseniae]NLR77022.1 alpha/beta hydrolase [Chitinophaga eiseniae]
MEKTDITAFRKELKNMVSQWTPKEKMPVSVVADKQIYNYLPIRIYRKDDSSIALPVLIFLHGGGWVRGDLDTHDDLCRRLVSQGDFMMVSVHYRLAPEYLFPYAMEDAFATLKWVLEHAAEIKADKGNIAVCGDSSGGNLALALVQQAKENDIALKGLVVAYPPLSYDFDTPSYHKFAEGYGLTTALMKELWNTYLGDTLNAENHFASVIRNDFVGYPTTLIIASDEDPLRDDGSQLFNKMVAASVAVTYSFYPGTRHAFLLRTAIEKAAITAQQEIINFLKNKVFVS